LRLGPHSHTFPIYIIKSGFTDSTSTTMPSSWTILSTLLQIDAANLQGHVVPTQDVATTSCKFDVRNGGNNLCEKGSASRWFRLLKSDPNPFHTLSIAIATIKFNTTPNIIANHIKPQQSCYAFHPSATYSVQQTSVLSHPVHQNIPRGPTYSFVYLSQRADWRMSISRIEPLLLLYANMLQCVG
jgi:hypothetical protein